MRQRNSGFSLLELLIVLVVMGVMISIASLSFRSFEVDPADKDMERLRYSVGVLVNEAIVRSEPLAIGFSGHGYAFFRMDDEGKWAVIDDDRLLKAHELDQRLEPQLVLDKESVTLGDEVGTEPHVFIYPTGEVTPFTYELTSKEGSAQRVQFDAMGQVVEDKADGDAKA